jgi:hypothetical protein
MGGPRGGRGWGRGGPFGPGFGPGDFGPAGPMYGRGGRVAAAATSAWPYCACCEQPMHGYQMIHERPTAAVAVAPSPNSVYFTLGPETRGCRSEKSSGKRIFHYRQRSADVATTLDSLRPGGRRPGRQRSAACGTSQQPPGHAGRPGGQQQQVATAQKILGDARRSLYLLLAEADDPEPGSAAPT